LDSGFGTPYIFLRALGLLILFVQKGRKTSINGIIFFLQKRLIEF